MIIRPMLPEDEDAVRAIYAESHPEQPTRPGGWFTAYPTLVAEDRLTIVGFTGFCLSAPGQGAAVTLYGNDLCVTPAMRNRGLGWRLAEARVAIGRAVGARIFIGITRVSNAGMIRIFERQGLHACQRLPGYFGTEDGVAWVGTL